MRREGIEIARWLREVCDVPIVFVTEQTDEDTAERIHEQVPGGTRADKAGLSSQSCRRSSGSDRALTELPMPTVDE
jgi:hypothetical protein